MTVDLTRRSFLAALLGTAVVAVLPKAALIEAAPPPIVAPIDPFAIQAPDGWIYQWVRCALYGEPDPANVELRLKNGWEFVRPALYPGAPVSTVERAISACGLILMEKPKAIVMAQQLSELQARNPHRIIVETPHGFEFQAKPREDVTT